VITIDAGRCTGCAACVEVCPTGALYLVEGRATLDGALCRECEACLAACPTGAIALAAQEEPVAEAARLPALRPEPEVIRVGTQPAPVPLRSRALPVVGAALAWAGREILPWLADFLLDRQATRRQARDGARGRETLATGAKGSGRQRRHRRRGGGG
jgi:NAD-dependent dihydropyrimidine dehydrogenase PreA subunit